MNKFHTVRGYELLGNSKDQLTPALEDYLEMIYRNSLDVSYIRVNTLAQLLNVRDSSASKMVKKLGELGLVNYEKYGIVTLTKEGSKTGEFLLSRHEIIDRFLTLIGCKLDTLVQTELIEHSISASTIKNIEILSNFLSNDKEILEKYRKYRENSISYHTL